MKKLALIGVVLLVIYLGFDYRTKKIQELGENLIANAYYGDLLAVKNGLEQGAPLDYVLSFYDKNREYSGVEFNVLQAAASSGNEDLINFLIDQGLNINYPTAQGWTPLFIAVRDGQAEAAKLLIFRQADLNAQTDLGATALIMALTQKFPSEKAREDLLVYMLKRGADPNLADNSRHTPLYYAAAVKNDRAVKLLYEYGAIPDEKTKEDIRQLLANQSDTASKRILKLLKNPPPKIKGSLYI